MLLPSCPISTQSFSKFAFKRCRSTGSCVPSDACFTRCSDSHSVIFSDHHSVTSSDSHPTTSSDAHVSSSLRVNTLLVAVKNTFSPANIVGCFNNLDLAGESDSEPDVDEAIRCLRHTDHIEPQSPSSSDWLHECECNPRSTCPEFLERHLAYLQTYEWHCVPGVVPTAYYISVDGYAQARNALSLPVAKLARAKAEYDWAMRRHQTDGVRLLAPRVHAQLVTARRKILAAERDLEAARMKRRQRAQLLIDMGGF